MYYNHHYNITVPLPYYYYCLYVFFYDNMLCLKWGCESFHINIIICIFDWPEITEIMIMFTVIATC